MEHVTWNIMTGSRSTCLIFMRALILGHQEMGTHIYQPVFELVLKLNSPVKNLFFELCTVPFKKYKMYIQLRFKMRTRFVSRVFIFPKTPNSIFTYQKSS